MRGNLAVGSVRQSRAETRRQHCKALLCFETWRASLGMIMLVNVHGGGFVEDNHMIFGSDVLSASQLPSLLRAGNRFEPSDWLNC